MVKKNVYEVDPEVYGPKHGYPADHNPFVGSRFSYTLNPDLLTGFKAAVNANQNNLALQYAVHMFEVLAELLSEKEKEELPTSAKPARSTVKATADTA